MTKKKEAFKHQQVVDRIISIIKKMPDGTQTSTSQIVEMIYGKPDPQYGGYKYGNLVIETMDYFEIDYCVWKQAKKEGINLDTSQWANCGVGLPFHAPFIVRHILNKNR